MLHQGENKIKGHNQREEKIKLYRLILSEIKFSSNFSFAVTFKFSVTFIVTAKVYVPIAIAVKFAVTFAVTVKIFYH